MEDGWVMGGRWVKDGWRRGERWIDERKNR